VRSVKWQGIYHLDVVSYYIMKNKTFHIHQINYRILGSLSLKIKPFISS